MGKSISSWSYTALAQWEMCPAQYKYQRIDKLPSESSPAMDRGNAIHKAAAAYIASTEPLPLPPELTKFAAPMEEFRQFPADWKVVEQQWGFTKSWRPTGWFGNDTWLRVVLDAGVVYPDGEADVVDHKTGKEYETNKDQRELNALALMCRYPHVHKVTSRMWYLDSGKETLETIEQERRTDLIDKWEKRVAPVFTDTVFAPRPNHKCRWCAYAKSKGGPCKFG